MTRNLSINLLVLLVVGLFSSCKKDASTVPDLGYNYFPDQVGHYVVYDVDSIYYNDFTGTVDTTRFQLKEKVESVYNDLSGRPSLRLERYRKYYNDTIPYASQAWVLSDVWSATKTSTRVEKIEENVSFVKLIFPVTKDGSWDGNAGNTIGSQTYSYLFVDQARMIAGVRYDSVLQVDQIEEANLIEKRSYTEKYGRNIGMLTKQVIDVQSQPPAAWAGTTYEADSLALFYAKPIMQRVSAGFQYTYTINSYGNE